MGEGKGGGDRDGRGTVRRPGWLVCPGGERVVAMILQRFEPRENLGFILGMAGLWDHGDQRGLWSDSCFHRVALAAGGGWTMGQEDVCGDDCRGGGSSGVGRSGGFGAHFQVKPAGFLRVEGVGWEKDRFSCPAPWPHPADWPCCSRGNGGALAQPPSPADKVPCGSQGRRGGQPGQCGEST